MFKGAVPETLEETGFSEMEKELTAYLINERGQAKLRKYVDRGAKFADELINNMINVRLKTVGLTANELEKKLKDAVPYFEKTKRECGAIINELKLALLNLETEFVNQYRNGLEMIARQANLAVNSYEGELEVELIARRIESVVAPLQKELMRELEGYKGKFIDMEVQKSIKKVQRIWDDMNFTFTNALSVVSEDYNRGIVNISSVQKDSLSDTDLLSGLVTGGIIIAAFHMPFIVIPAANLWRQAFYEFF